MRHSFNKNYLDFILGFNIRDSITPLGDLIELEGEIKFDTGSDLTIFPACQLGFQNIKEIDFIDWLKSNKKAYSVKFGHSDEKSLYYFSSGGIDSYSVLLRSYAYQVDSFILELDDGNIDLGSVPITVTFDNRFIRPLLGKDLISLLISKIDTNNNYLDLELNAMMNSTDRRTINTWYMYTKGYYRPKDYITKESLDDLKREVLKVVPTYIELLKKTENQNEIIKALNKRCVELKKENVRIREHNNSLNIMNICMKNNKDENM